MNLTTKSHTPALFSNAPAYLLFLLGATGFWTVHQSQFWSGAQNDDPKEKTGTLVKEEGGVRHKSSGSIIWRDLHQKRKPLSVSYGDSVFTDSGGTALLKLGAGSTATLSPNSLVVINPPEADTQAPQELNWFERAVSKVSAPSRASSARPPVLQVKQGQIKISVQPQSAPVRLQVGGKTFEISQKGASGATTPQVLNVAVKPKGEGSMESVVQFSSSDQKSSLQIVPAEDPKNSITLIQNELVQLQTESNEIQRKPASEMMKIESVASSETQKELGLNLNPSPSLPEETLIKTQESELGSLSPEKVTAPLMKDLAPPKASPTPLVQSLPPKMEVKPTQAEVLPTAPLALPAPRVSPSPKPTLADEEPEVIEIEDAYWPEVPRDETPTQLGVRITRNQSLISASTSTGTAKLVAPPSTGVELEWTQRWARRWKSLVNLGFEPREYLAPATVTLTQLSKLLWKIHLGAIYRISKIIDLTFLTEINRRNYLSTATPTTLTLDGATIMGTSAQSSFHLLPHHRYFDLTLYGKGYVELPSQHPLYKTSVGYGGESGAYFGWKIKQFTAITQIFIQYQNNNNSFTTQNNISLGASLGMRWNFGSPDPRQTPPAERTSETIEKSPEANLAPEKITADPSTPEKRDLNDTKKD